jgi:hypothetical protein
VYWSIQPMMECVIHLAWQVLKPARHMSVGGRVTSRI